VVAGSRINRLEEEASEAIYSDVNDEIDTYSLETIARISNCILGLAAHSVALDDRSIQRCVDASFGTSVGELLNSETMSQTIKRVLYSSK